MDNIYYRNNQNSKISFNKDSLYIDCDNCFALCCVALYFSASEGFPKDKHAGEPCPNLQSDFRCKVHSHLIKKGYKGCCAFDCFGAGPKVSQHTFGGVNWKTHPESAKLMFDAFLVMRQLHELLWYLTVNIQPEQPIYEELSIMLDKTLQLTYLNPDSLVKLDVAAHREKVNAVLLKISELVRAQASLGKNQNKKPIRKSKNYIAANLKGYSLVGSNLRGACFIAADLRDVDFSGADLIGSDFRDANICGADLSGSIFLTQAQLNVSKGDFATKLPSTLSRPIHWTK